MAGPYFLLIQNSEKMRLKELKVKRNGKRENLPIHFGFNTQADFCEHRGISIQDWDSRVGGDQMRLADISALTFFALKRGHERSPLKDIPFDITLDDIGNIFDENPDAITNVFSMLVDSQPKAKEDADPEEGNVQG